MFKLLAVTLICLGIVSCGKKKVSKLKIVFSVSVQDDSTLHAIPAVSIIPGTLHKGDNIQIIDIFNADHSEKIGISVSSLDKELLAKAELQPDRRSVRVVSKDWLDASLESSSRFNRSGSGSGGMNDFIFEVKQ